jgi:hypothetical protein
MDDASGFLFSDWASETGVSQNHFDRRAERARSAFDRGQVLSIYGLAASPFRGRAFRDWSVSGILQASTGAPLTATLGTFSNTGSITSAPAERPDVYGVASAQARGCAGAGTPDRWIDASSFALPAPGSHGNAGRNTLCGPGLMNVDASLARKVQLREGMLLQFRMELFNVLNHANFDVPLNTSGPAGNGGNGEAIFIGRRRGCVAASAADGCGVPAANVGRIFRTVTGARQLQLSLRLQF